MSAAGISGGGVSAVSNGSPVAAVVPTADTEVFERAATEVVEEMRAGSSLWIFNAVVYLGTAERNETCEFCRSHITATRVVAADLLAISLMGEDLRKHEALRGLAVKLGELGESTGALALIARVIHRVRGLSR